MQDNATPLSPASFMTRIAAMIYELLLVTAVVFVASFIIAPVVGELHAPWQRHLFQGYILSVLFIYFSTFWLRSGQTLAMKTWRIRLVRQNGEPPYLEAGSISLCTCLDWDSARRRWALVGAHRPRQAVSA